MTYLEFLELYDISKIVQEFQNKKGEDHLHFLFNNVIDINEEIKDNNIEIDLNNEKEEKLKLYIEVLKKKISTKEQFENFDEKKLLKILERKFENTYPEIFEIYKKNENEIITFYFKELISVIEENRFLDFEKFSYIFTFKVFDVSCSKDFLEVLNKIELSLKYSFKQKELLNFTWNILDIVLHEGINLEYEDDYKIILIKLKNLSVEFDFEDHFLLQQKIEQFGL